MIDNLTQTITEKNATQNDTEEPSQNPSNEESDVALNANIVRLMEDEEVPEDMESNRPLNEEKEKIFPSYAELQKIMNKKCPSPRTQNLKDEYRRL